MTYIEAVSIPHCIPFLRGIAQKDSAKAIVHLNQSITTGKTTS